MRKAITSVAGGKILLAKTNWFFHEKSSTFQNFRLHSLHLSCHSTCPLSLRILLSKRQSRLYESLPELCAGAIRVSETNSSILEPKLAGKVDFS